MVFFDQRKQARTFRPDGPLAILSNFAGPDYDAGEEAINLFPRIRQPFRVIARSQAAAASFTGLQAIYYVDRDAPDAALRQKLIAFAQGGGTVFVPSTWPNPEGTPVPAEPYLLFKVRSLGKGRLAVCKDEAPDPYDVVADIQNIISHRNDILRLYNAPSMNFLYETAAPGKQGVIHLLNYSRRPGSDGPLFYVKEPHKSARLVSPEMASPTGALPGVSPDVFCQDMLVRHPEYGLGRRGARRRTAAEGACRPVTLGRRHLRHLDRMHPQAELHGHQEEQHDDGDDDHRLEH